MAPHRSFGHRPVTEGLTGAFEDFYRLNYEAVARYVARRLPMPSLDDVVAQVFIVAWRKFASAPAPSLSWLYRIAGHEVAHERRRLARRGTVSIDLFDPPVRASSDESFSVAEAFAQLSESDAELLRLVHWEGLGRAEVAEVLSISVNALNVRYHRAIERLAGALDRSNRLSALPARTHHAYKEMK